MIVAMFEQPAYFHLGFGENIIRCLLTLALGTYWPNGRAGREYLWLKVMTFGKIFSPVSANAVNKCFVIWSFLDPDLGGIKRKFNGKYTKHVELRGSQMNNWCSDDFFFDFRVSAGPVIQPIPTCSRPWGRSWICMFPREMLKYLVLENALGNF